MLKVDLYVALAFLTSSRLGSFDDTENAGTDAFGNPLDDAAFARSIPPLEDHDHALTLVDFPFLKLHAFAVPAAELAFVRLLVELPATGPVGFAPLIHFAHKQVYS